VDDKGDVMDKVLLSRQELDKIRETFEQNSSICLHYNPDFLLDLVEYVDRLQQVTWWLSEHCPQNAPIRADDKFWQTSPDASFPEYWIMKAYEMTADLHKEEYPVEGV
jgi:hypothetical protein